MRFWRKGSLQKCPCTCKNKQIFPKNNNGTLVPAITSHLQISWQKMYTKKLNLLRLSFVVKHFFTCLEKYTIVKVCTCIFITINKKFSSFRLTEMPSQKVTYKTVNECYIKSITVLFIRFPTFGDQLTKSTKADKLKDAVFID